MTILGNMNTAQKAELKAAVNSVGGVVSDELAGQAAAQVARLENPVNAFAVNGGKVIRIAIVADSYGSPATGDTDPKTFAIPLAAALRSQFGDAGAGYIPWADGKMSTLGHSSNFTIQGGLGPGSSYWPWNDPHRSTAPMGIGYYRDGGAGQLDSNEYTQYTPNAADSYSRGVVETLSVVSVHFTLRSALAGFAIRETDTSSDAALRVSSGATFTGSATASTTLAASSVSGVISLGAYLSGASVPAARTIKSAVSASYGGAGNYVLNSSSTVTGTVTATGNVQPVVGIPQRATFTKTAGKANNVQIVGTYGDVLINGIEHYNGNAGVTITDFSQSGTSVVQWASLDDAAQRAFWRMMAFDIVIVVGGMNDRISIPPQAYGTAMATVIGRIQSSPNTQVVAVRQTDPADAATTYFSAYEPVLQNVCVMMGAGYFDMKSASPSLATYVSAVAAGAMFDAVHLNGVGNTLVSAAFAPLAASMVPAR